MLLKKKILKFIYSEKATKFCEISTVDLSYVCSNCKIYGGDFAKVCGLLRIYELYFFKICNLKKEKTRLPFLFSNYKKKSSKILLFRQELKVSYFSTSNTDVSILQQSHFHLPTGSDMFCFLFITCFCPLLPAMTFQTPKPNLTFLSH